MNNQRPADSFSSDRPLLHGVDWAVQAGVTEEVMRGARGRARRRRQQRLALATVAGGLMMGSGG